MFVLALLIDFFCFVCGFFVGFVGHFLGFSTFFVRKLRQNSPPGWGWSLKG